MTDLDKSDQIVRGTDVSSMNKDAPSLLETHCRRLSSNDPELTLLDISGNHIGDNGAKALALVLKGNSTPSALSW